MEAIIARLLEGFEQGRIKRRQLIQSLAVAATGARVLGSAVGRPRRDQGTPEMNYDSYHILDPDGWDLQISR
jgi:hypothetical protein